MIYLEGSQTSPARPSEKGSVKVKTIDWLPSSGLRQGHAGFFIS
jgi:hypothetical protein